MDYIFNKPHRRMLGIAFQILFIFALPVFLLYFGIFPIQTRLYLLAIFAIFTLLSALNKHYSSKSLGIRTDNFRHSVIPYIIFTIVSSIIVIGIAMVLNFSMIPNWYTNYSLIFLFLPISAIQEFMYRGFLIKETEKITKNVYIVIATNTILFALLHIFYINTNLPYDGLFLILPISIAAGLGFSIMYHFYPYLYLIAASHAILNLITTVFSFFYP